MSHTRDSCILDRLQSQMQAQKENTIVYIATAILIKAVTLKQLEHCAIILESRRLTQWIYTRAVSYTHLRAHET